MKNDDPNIFVRWVMVPHPRHRSTQIGISDDGRWVVLTKDGLAFIDEKSYYPGLLPFLEVPRPVFDSELKGAIRSLALPDELALGFPIEKVTISALKAWGDYWPALALNWAETIPASDTLVEVLGQLTRHGPTQQIRHKANHVFGKSHRKDGV